MKAYDQLLLDQMVKPTQYIEESGYLNVMFVH